MKKNFNFVCILIFMILGLLLLPQTYFAQASSTVIYPMDDAYVDSGEPDTTHDSSFLNSGKWAGENREMQTYISFDLSNVSSGWSSAKLTFWFFFILFDVDVEMVKIGSSWNEHSLTWNNKPSLGQKISDLDVRSTATEYKKVIDITSVIDQELSFGEEWFSLCIHMPVNQGAVVGIYSKDIGSNLESFWPKLTFGRQESIPFMPTWAVFLISTLSVSGIIIYLKKKIDI